eukprot:TRINITY_DN40906_c0_g1_i1.p1 TRINITY_DN40906_c0_g1~~TRINITY_DN40906_c0_g1_i1.p1  ORF type:complete len:384 (-),score=53.94 TRINITY_DN40906_c0_g1_i1:52-1170(-)
MTTPNSLRVHNLSYTASVCLRCQHIGLALRQPKVLIAFMIAIPNALFGAALKYWSLLDGETDVMDQEAYRSLSFLLFFLLALRAQTAYDRFWNGTDFAYLIAGQNFQAACDIISFCTNSKANKEDLEAFHQKFLRLCSLTNYVILAELQRDASILEGQKPRDLAADWELLDIQGLDEAAIVRLLQSECKVEIVLQWLQQCLVRAWHQNVFAVGSPLLSRAFYDLSSGICKYHNAQAVTEVPFPFPLSVALQLLMITHWCTTPVIAFQWTEYVTWVMLFCFANTFTVWLLAGLCYDIEEPFGSNVNCIRGEQLQQRTNARLQALVGAHNSPQPKLTHKACDALDVQKLPKGMGLQGLLGSLSELEQLPIIYSM